MNRIIFVIPIFLFLASCGNENYIYSEKKAVNPAGWAYADSLDFNFEMKDTSLVYSILLDIDHSTDYPYQNIYFNIATTFPSGKKLQQQLPSDLADKTGKWHGNCSGKNCTAAINLQEKAKFDEIGTHKITISQYSRDSALLGIQALTLKLEEFKLPNLE